MSIAGGAGSVAGVGAVSISSGAKTDAGASAVVVMSSTDAGTSAVSGLVTVSSGTSYNGDTGADQPGGQVSLPLGSAHGAVGGTARCWLDLRLHHLWRRVHRQRVQRFQLERVGDDPIAERRDKWLSGAIALSSGTTIAGNSGTALIGSGVASGRGWWSIRRTPWRVGDILAAIARPRHALLVRISWVWVTRVSPRWRNGRSLEFLRQRRPSR